MLARSRSPLIPGHMGGIVAVATLLATLPACSTVNDGSHPVEWYKSVRDWVSDNQINSNAKDKIPDIPGQDRPFPKVSSVPEAPPKTSGEERNKAAKSLISDRENAKYTDEIIRRQTTFKGRPPRPNLTRRSPATSSVTPSNVSPSRLEFGSPPTDIILTQERRLGSARPAPTIPPAPDPASLDPSSQVAIVTFSQGSSKLLANARRIIREVAELQRDRGGNIYVIGHLSSLPTNLNSVRHHMKYFGLSLERANTVAQELLRLGLKINMVSIGAMQNLRPLKLDGMSSRGAGDDRVEIFLEGG